MGLQTAVGEVAALLRRSNGASRLGTARPRRSAATSGRPARSPSTAATRYRYLQAPAAAVRSLRREGGPGRSISTCVPARNTRWLAQPWLWLGSNGRLTDSGAAQLLERRSVKAGLGRIHPHQLRHTFAHAWLAQGAQRAAWVVERGSVRAWSKRRQPCLRPCRAPCQPGSRELVTALPDLLRRLFQRLFVLLAAEHERPEHHGGSVGDGLEVAPGHRSFADVDPCGCAAAIVRPIHARKH